MTRVFHPLGDDYREEFDARDSEQRLRERATAKVESYWRTQWIVCRHSEDIAFQSLAGIFRAGWPIAPADHCARWARFLNDMVICH